MGHIRLSVCTILVLTMLLCCNCSTQNKFKEEYEGIPFTAELEAFKDACEDGKVSEKQRRLLEKLRVMYGISEERAREIEKL